MIKAIIIEDELNIQEVIQHIISKHFPHIKILDKCQRVSEAVKSIERYKPDLIFLDIEIIEGTGFDVLTQTSNIAYDVIFVTGYDQYAIKALRASAIDYILKPISISEMKEALDRLDQKLNINTNAEAYLTIEGARHSERVMQTELTYIEIKKNLTVFHIKNGSQQMSAHPISKYLEGLNSSFMQIHRNYIVNITSVLKIDVGRGGFVHLMDGSKIPIAYRRKAKLEKMWRDHQN